MDRFIDTAHFDEERRRFIPELGIAVLRQHLFLGKASVPTQKREKRKRRPIVPWLRNLTFPWRHHLADSHRHGQLLFVRGAARNGARTERRQVQV